MNRPQPNILQSLWPKTDWASYINDDRDDEVINILTNIYQNIRLAPRKKEPPLSDEQWQDAYTTGIAVLKAIFRKTKTIEQAKNINARFCERFGIDYAEITKLHLNKSYLYWAISKKPLNALGQDALEIDTSNHQIKSEEVTPDLTVQKETENKTEELNEVVSETPKPSKVKKGRFGPVFAEKDIELDHFRLEFGLRQIVMSANSLIEPQILLNQCYESLCDLAEALEIPRKWVGLNALILRIGHSDMLDTEDKYQSITYAGEEIHQSIAHQWIKCLDARFATAIQANMQTFDRYISTMYQNELTGTHTEKIKAIYLIVKKITKNMSNFSSAKMEYLKDSANFESSKGLPSGTLTAMPEMFARSFDAYVEDRLAALSRTNHFLTADTVNQPEAVYPQDSERKEISQLFAALFRAMKQADSASQNLTSQKNQ